MLAAAWLTAAATLGLFLGAVVTAIFAIKAFGKQSAEVGILQQQFAEQQEFNRQQAEVLNLQARDLRESHTRLKRDQAARINVWEERGPDPRVTQSQVAAGAVREETVTVYVENTSEQLIHDVRVHWKKGGRPWIEPGRQRLVMPGKIAEFTQPLSAGESTGHDPPVIEADVYFQDAAAVHWLLPPGGGPPETALPDYEPSQDR